MREQLNVSELREQLAGIWLAVGGHNHEPAHRLRTFLSLTSSSSTQGTAPLRVSGDESELPVEHRRGSSPEPKAVEPRRSSRSTPLRMARNDVTRVLLGCHGTLNLANLGIATLDVS